MKTKIHIIVAMSMALFCSSCDDYLDKLPSTSSYTPITEASQLMGLIDNTSNTNENSFLAMCATDDNGLTNGLLDVVPSYASSLGVFTALYSEGIANRSSDSFWSGEYKKIFIANTVIAEAGNVDNKEIAEEAVANAYFMRAWSLFTLAQYYCLPYSESNRNELGLPLRTGTDFEENIGRATLGETYEQILNDLKKAEQVRQDNVDLEKRWRSSKCAVYALYARVYLAMGDYQKALDYSTLALPLAPSLIDYQSLKAGSTITYPQTSYLPEQTVTYCETYSWYMKDYLYYGEAIFARFTINDNQWYIPSQKLIAEYDRDKDLRYKWFCIEHGNRARSVNYDEYGYYQFNSGRCIFSGLGTPELMLVKAEAMARLGNWTAALAELSELRRHRMSDNADIVLPANNAEQAVKAILAERHRELPFSVRMMDIKRLAVNDVSYDDITIERDFYKFTMSGMTDEVQHLSVKGNDNRLALPIVTVEINSSNGSIKQNKY